MITRPLNVLYLLVKILLVLVYIIFEELIWEGIAKPVYEFIHSLKILQKVEVKLSNANASIILVIFVVLFSIVEALGIYAGILFVSGQVLLGITLYVSKIPIAAFTFWIFRITEDKLMQFGWFKWTYSWIITAFEWIQNTRIYRKVKYSIYLVKKYARNVVKDIKGGASFISEMKKIYINIKKSFKKKTGKQEG